MLSDVGKSFDCQRKMDWLTKCLGHSKESILQNSNKITFCVSFVKALQNYQELFLDSPLDSASFINFLFS